MGEMSDAGQTKKQKGILDQNRPLKTDDFCPGKLEEWAEELHISKPTLLKEINLFRDILERHSCIIEDSDRDGKLFLTEFGPKVIIWARNVRKRGIRGDQNVRIAALEEFIHWLWETHVDEVLLIRERRKSEELASQVLELRKQNDQLHNNIERFEGMSRMAQALADERLKLADQRLKQVKALKNLITAMTFAQTKEREALVKQFMVGKIGSIVDTYVWERNS